MYTVADEAGDRYVLVEWGSDSWLIRDPETGTETRLPATEATLVENVSPLETAAAGIPAAVRELLTQPTPRALGLLAEIHRRGPVGVRALQTGYDICESDLHGLLAEFRAAGLVRETRVAGERGYTATADLAARLD